MMDKAEKLVNGNVTQPADGLCTACHQVIDDITNSLDHTGVLPVEGCDLDNEPDWYQHLTQGRVAEAVWEDVSLAETGTLCGW
jgi:hypothetical protein